MGNLWSTSPGQELKLGGRTVEGNKRKTVRRLHARLQSARPRGDSSDLSRYSSHCVLGADSRLTLPFFRTTPPLWLFRARHFPSPPRPASSFSFNSPPPLVYSPVDLRIPFSLITFSAACAKLECQTKKNIEWPAGVGGAPFFGSVEGFFSLLPRVHFVYSGAGAEIIVISS